MTYGISVKTDANAFALSDTYSSMAFIGKYTAAVATSGTNQGSASFTITGLAAMPIVFIENPGAGYYCTNVYTINNGGGSYTIYAAARASTYPSSLTVYVFSKTNSSSASGYGIQVFDSSNNPMFDSNNRVLSISGYHVTSTGSTSAPPLIQTLTAGTIPSSWAIATAELGVSFTGVTPALTLVHYTGARKNSSTQIAFSPGMQFGTRGGNTTLISVQANRYCLFIDATLYQ